MIEKNCPHCGEMNKYADEKRGKKVNCRFCQKTFFVSHTETVRNSIFMIILFAFVASVLLCGGLLCSIESDNGSSYKTSSSASSSDCYDLGYRYGRCATLATLGYTCPPRDDFIMPAECRDTEEAKRGINAGVKSVYEEYGIPSQ